MEESSLEQCYKWAEVHRKATIDEFFWFFLYRIGYGLGSGSDFLAFDQLAGSSNFDTSYTFNRDEHGGIGSYPLYHTSYESFSMMQKFIDPEFQVYRSFFFKY